MRWLSILFVTLLLSGQTHAAEQKPWRCITEKSVGAKTTDGEIRSASFSDRTEFRIKPLGAWVDDLTGDGFFKRLFQISLDSATEEAGVGVSLIRKVSEDPKKFSSWAACRVNELPAYADQPAYNLLFCDAPLVLGIEVRINTWTGRFTSMAFGDWHATAPGEKPTSDSWFDFGTCAAYYD